MTAAMKRHYKLAVSIVVLLACLASGAFAQRQPRESPCSARQVVQSFYRFHLAHDMGFTGRNIERRRRWLTPELYDLLRAELRRSAKQSAKHPDEEPFFDGDPFTDSQDTPNSFRLGKIVESGNTATVEIVFVWGAASSRDREERTAIITLSKSAACWQIGNVKNADDEDLLTLLHKARE